MNLQNPYDQFREIKAAQGVKVLAKELDKALAGTSLLVARHDDEIQILRVIFVVSLTRLTLI